MDLKSIYCTLLIGPTIPIPIPTAMTEAVQNVEVVHRDDSRSGFQITFRIGKSSSLGVFDYDLLENPFLKAFNRIVILATVNAMPRMIMDGIITNIQLTPGTEPGAGKLIITGEDISVLMDMTEKVVAHTAQSDYMIANKIIAEYSQYGIVPEVVVPSSLDVPDPLQFTPIQRETDLAYLKRLAVRYGYVFYVDTGPIPSVNTAYWGPKKWLGEPQSALCAANNLGRNINTISFNLEGMAPVGVSGFIQDRASNEQLPIEALVRTQIPLSQSAAENSKTRHIKLSETTAGLSFTDALARAQARTNTSYENVVTAEGELDVTVYGEILKARSLVGMKGAGRSYDGLYYVAQVTHQLRPGSYQQKFKLNRDGLGSTVPLLPST